MCQCVEGVCVWRVCGVCVCQCVEGVCVCQCVEGVNVSGCISVCASVCGLV